MCGFAGHFDHRGNAPDRETGLAMAELLRHRGPDRRSAWRCPSGMVTLGHARLNVIDLDTGDQPMVSHCGRFHVVFNGEVYNFLDVRRELEGAGHAFRTRSDTEVILEGFRKWGAEVVDRLDGMFTFALWDSVDRRLMLARDRAGKKPLFLWERGDGLAFASEIKAFRALPGGGPRVDPARLPEYLSFGYAPSPSSFFQGVRQLPPGTTLVLDSDGRAVEREYWNLLFRGESISEKDAIEQARHLLTESVRRRLISDVPLGAFLSGGIDSTLVVGLMSRLLEEPVRTFSIGFEDDPNYDESPFARAVAEQIGTEHTEFRVGAQSFELLDELVEAHDQPFGDSSAIPTSIVSGLARGEVTVALTGDGGDELFAGYPRFAGFALAEAVPSMAVRMASSLVGLIPHSDDFRSISRRAGRFLAAAGLPPDERMLRWIGYLPSGLEGLVQPELLAGLDRHTLLRSFREPLVAAAGGTALDRVLTLNFRTYLLDDLLVKVDRCSMHHSLELRAPFLDTALMEFAAVLPDRLRVRGRTLKYLLKTAFPDLLPEAIRNRPKWGFGVPLPTWFRGEWREPVGDRIADPDSLLYQWLQPAAVQRLWAEHQAGSHDHAHALWALLTLESWMRQNAEAM